MRRIGVLIVPSENDPQSRARVAALQQGLGELGWIVGRNLQIDYRFGISDDQLAQTAAADLLRLGADVVIANSPPAVGAVQAADRTIPIVFVAVSEPVALGLVASLARPGGSTTGFLNIEPSLGGKWLELLKEMAPQLTRAVFMFSPTGGQGPLIVRATEQAAIKDRSGTADHSGPYACGDRSCGGELGSSAGQRFDRSTGYSHNTGSQADCRTGGEQPPAIDLCISVFRRRRRVGFLRPRCR